MERVLVRGANDVGSAVAHRLFTAGFAVVVHEEPYPTTSRRSMAFTDAVFDGQVSLAGVPAARVDDLPTSSSLLEAHAAVLVLTADVAAVLDLVRPHILIDARMRKRAHPESQLGLAGLTIGLGPNFVAGETTDLVVETAWGDDLGRVYDRGATRPLEGEPQELGGHARDRFVYAPAAGIFRTEHRIGQLVAADEVIAFIDGTVASRDGISLRAPLAGMLRGMTHDGVPVSAGTKVIEVDARGSAAALPTGIGRRPACIADGILAVLERRSLSPAPRSA